MKKIIAGLFAGLILTMGAQVLAYGCEGGVCELPQSGNDGAYWYDDDDAYCDSGACWYDDDDAYCDGGACWYDDDDAYCDGGACWYDDDDAYCDGGACWYDDDDDDAYCYSDRSGGGGYGCWRRR